MAVVDRWSWVLRCKGVQGTKITVANGLLVTPKQVIDAPSVYLKMK